MDQAARAAKREVRVAARDPEHYKALLPAELGVVHATVEVHECREQPTPRFTQAA